MAQRIYELRQKVAFISVGWQHARRDERESWTDERLDEFGKRIDERFDRVDERFEEVDRRFEQVDRRFEQVDKRFDRIERRLDILAGSLGSMQRTMVLGVIALFSAYAAGFAALITQV